MQNNFNAIELFKANYHIQIRRTQTTCIRCFYTRLSTSKLKSQSFVLFTNLAKLNVHLWYDYCIILMWFVWHPPVENIETIVLLDMNVEFPYSPINHSTLIPVPWRYCHMLLPAATMILVFCDSKLQNTSFLRSRCLLSILVCLWMEDGSCTIHSMHKCWYKCLRVCSLIWLLMMVQRHPTSIWRCT